jgi:hypothetical protein
MEKRCLMGYCGKIGSVLPVATKRHYRKKWHCLLTCLNRCRLHNPMPVKDFCAVTPRLYMDSA